MTDALWGFLGVIVGGFITSLWAWLALIRQELSDSVVAARLIDGDLVDARPTQSVWTTNQAAFARAVGLDQWVKVRRAYETQTPSAVVIAEARHALAPLVAGKRYVMRQRLSNMLHSRRHVKEARESVIAAGRNAGRANPGVGPDDSA